jgi:hypothetical protein
MRVASPSFRFISCFLALGILVGFAPIYFLEAAESKEEDIVTYIKDVSSMMTNVDIVIRNIGLNYLPMNEGVRRMDIYITQLGFMQYPEDLSRLHKMILFSFKKLRMGLLLFSVERKEISVGLIKSGTRLLKYAANNMLEIAKSEGIIQKKELSEED